MSENPFWLAIIILVFLVALFTANYRQHNPFSSNSILAQKLSVANENIRRNPKDFKAYIERGNIYNDGEEYAQAIADYNEAIRLNPKNAEAYVGRGFVYEMQWQHQKAIADYNEAIRLNSKLEMAYVNRGVSYRQLGEYEKAITDYNQALLLNPKLAIAYFNRGITYGFKGGSFSQVPVGEPRDIAVFPEDHIRERSSLFAQKEIADYSTAINLNPKLEMAYMNRGEAYRQLGDLSKAKADYQRVLQLNPNNNEALRRLNLLRGN